jgi:hypothetical protein
MKVVLFNAEKKNMFLIKYPSGATGLFILDKSGWDFLPEGQTTQEETIAIENCSEEDITNMYRAAKTSAVPLNFTIS